MFLSEQLSLWLFHEYQLPLLDCEQDTLINDFQSQVVCLDTVLNKYLSRWMEIFDAADKDSLLTGESNNRVTILLSHTLWTFGFKFVVTEERQCDLISVCDGSSAQPKLLKFLLVTAVQRRGSWKLLLCVCGHRRAEEKKLSVFSHLCLCWKLGSSPENLKKVVGAQLSKWFLNLSLERISY